MELLKRVFRATGQATLDLDSIPAHIAIKRSADSVVKVLIQGSEKYRDQFSAEQSGDTVRIRGPKKSSELSIRISEAGRDIFVSGVRSKSLSVSCGRIILDGNDITEQARAAALEDDIHVEILLPEESNLILGDLESLIADLSVNQVLLKLVNQGSVTLPRVAELNGTLGGQSKLRVGLLEGTRHTISLTTQAECKVSEARGCSISLCASGQSRAWLHGFFSELQLTASQRGTVSSQGAVSGDLSALASDRGRITHEGEVKGRVSKQQVGDGTVLV